MRRGKGGARTDLQIPNVGARASAVEVVKRVEQHSGGEEIARGVAVCVASVEGGEHLGGGGPWRRRRG